MSNAPPDPKCEGCGKRPEVEGSSWCAACHETLPQYVKERILALRNALHDYLAFHTSYDIREGHRKRCGRWRGLSCDCHGERVEKAANNVLGQVKP